MIFQFFNGKFASIVFSKAFGSFRSFAVGTCRTALPRLPSGTAEICLGSAGWRPARGEHRRNFGEAGESDTSSSLISVFHSFTFENHWRSEKYRFNASPHLVKPCKTLTKRFSVRCFRCEKRARRFFRQRGSPWDHHGITMVAVQQVPNFEEVMQQALEVSVVQKEDKQQAPRATFDTTCLTRLFVFGPCFIWRISPKTW